MDVNFDRSGRFECPREVDALNSLASQLLLATGGAGFSVVFGSLIFEMRLKIQGCAQSGLDHFMWQLGPKFSTAVLGWLAEQAWRPS